jgi:hypothetical protein
VEQSQNHPLAHGDHPCRGYDYGCLDRPGHGHLRDHGSQNHDHDHLQEVHRDHGPDHAVEDAYLIE